MLIKTKKLVSFVLAFLMLLTVFPSESFAADPPSSSNQIINHGKTQYYDQNGVEVTESPVLGENAAVSVAKTIEGTDVENEFIINLEVNTATNISSVSLSGDAAVVLVLDISDSMDTNDRIGDLREAASAFLDSYAVSVDGAKRYISLVTFNTIASIKETWIDVSDPTNLTAMKTMIGSLETAKNGTYGNTFMQGGLVFARNLMRTDAINALQVSEAGSTPIANRSVILFSDGEANYYEMGTSRSTYNIADWTATDVGSMAAARNLAATAASQVKDATSFTVAHDPYTKYTSKLYTIAYGDAAPADWLRDSISSGSDYAFSGATVAELDGIFETIFGHINSWTDVWKVTDPMGENIEFMTDISQGDLDAGLLQFEDNTLTWDLKEATPTNYDESTGIYTYTYSYRIKLDTTSVDFVANTPNPTNGTTELSYIMIEGGEITGSSMMASFSVPEVEGYADGSFDFTKVGDNTEILAGCEFTLTNQNKGDQTTPDFTAVSDANGKVSFVNIPSGHTYLLKETSMPDVYKDRYQLNSEMYTVTVSYGNVIIKDSKENDVTNKFKFNNPLWVEKKVVSETGKDGAAVGVGDELTYEIGYVNYEADPATIVITDQLPEGLTFVSAANDGVYDPDTHTVKWTLTDIAGGASDKVSLVVKVNEKAVIKIENNAGVQVGNNPSQETTTAGNSVTPEEPEKEYSVGYIFKSDDGSALPPEVLAMLPVDSNTYADGDTVAALTPGETTVTVTDGSWTFISWDADSKTISGEDVTFVGTWTFTGNEEPEGYHAGYTFVSGAAGKALLQEIWEQLPADGATYADGDTVTALAPGQTTVTTANGTWTFDGWDANSKTISGADVTFVGTWMFTGNEEPEGYYAGYTFVSGVSGKTLPQEVWAQLPADGGTYADGGTVTALAPGQTTVTAANGTWRFDGWDADSKTISGADVTFVGTWTFIINEEPDEYKVGYIFESDNGTALPPEVLVLLPVDSNTYADGDTVTVINPDQTTVETENGTWIFTGWDKDSATV